MSQRVGWIDTVKGIAILLVVLGHIVPADSRIGQWIYSFHVPVFFIVSGILLSYKQNWKENAFGEIIVKKVKQLLFPYLTFSMVSIVFIFIADNVQSGIDSIVKMVCFEGISALWFLPALLGAELIFIGSKKYWSVKYSFVFYLFLLIVTFLFSVHSNFYTEKSSIRFVWDIANIINRSLIGSFFVFIGYYGIELKKRLKIKKYIFVLLGALAIIINLTSYRYNNVDLHYSIIGNPILYYINALCGSYSLIIVAKCVGERCKIFSFYGSNSLIILATHLNWKIIGSVKRILVLLHWNHAVVCFLFVVIIETLLILLINRFGKSLVNYDLFSSFVCRYSAHTRFLQFHNEELRSVDKAD